MLQWLREAAHFLQDGMGASCCSAAHEGVGNAERAARNSWGGGKRAGAAYAYTALSVYSAQCCQCRQRRYAVTRGYATSRPDRVSLIRRDTASCIAPHRRLHAVLCGALAYSVDSALPQAHQLQDKTRLLSTPLPRLKVVINSKPRTFQGLVPLYLS